MTRCARVRFFLLALMVAASHVVWVGHATAHFQPALEHCELCVSQAQPLAAVPSAETVFTISCSPSARVPDADGHLSSGKPAYPQHQRAPPRPSD